MSNLQLTEAHTADLDALLSDNELQLDVFVPAIASRPTAHPAIEGAVQEVLALFQQEWLVEPRAGEIFVLQRKLRH
ncbi:hypothetical protein BDD12DRAFT_876780 [Trichophaea hybrida]|nr:hypothetical protein BDD12DRAFT_876780 [Trichophaea hybrida]